MTKRVISTVSTIPTISLADYPYSIAKTDPVFNNYIANETGTIINTCDYLKNKKKNLYNNVVLKLQRGIAFTSGDEAVLKEFAYTKAFKCDSNINTCCVTNVEASGKLHELFNTIVATKDYNDFITKQKLILTPDGHLVNLFSIIKQCQTPDSYPIRYLQWVNLNEHCKWSTTGNNDYDRLCELYKSINIPATDIPRHLYFAAYLEYLAHQLMNIIAPTINDYSKAALHDLFNQYKEEIDSLRAGKSSISQQSQSISQASQSTPHVSQPTPGLTTKSHPLNLILYGPPGTGKTYNTLFHALAIINNQSIDNLIAEKCPGKTSKDILTKEEYKWFKDEFDKKVKTGQIVFTTFHQSMSYEDFIEGIKPIPPQDKDEQMVYDVQDGIFKQICEKAKKITAENKSAKIDFSKTRVFKLSLGEKGKDADSVFEYCVENEVIALGWGGSKDFSKCKTKADFQALDSTWGAAALEIFKEWMKKGDVVLISDGTKEVKGIAQVIGDYEFRDDPSIDMHQFRKVKWLYTGDNIPISKLYDKNLSQQSIYGFYKKKNGPVDNGGIKVDVLNDIITGEINDKKEDNYVLIIDEINRGNVAQIFGELITLIEDYKRLDSGKEDMTATLPYSQKPFGVPNNLYIIGTMNTADRSVEALDTALRRRFSFEEMMPNPELLKDTDDKYIEVCGVKLRDLLDTLNKRIVALKDREHQIGHSYFMGCPKDATDEAKEQWLAKVFKDNIIPLLQEYFYGDYKKIYYVLGPGFVKEVSENKPEDIFPVRIDDELDINQSMTRYEIKSFDEEETDINNKVNIFVAVNRLVKSKSDKDNLRIKLKDQKYQEAVDEGGTPKTIDIPLEVVIERILGGEDMSKCEVKSEEPTLSR